MEYFMADALNLYRVISSKLRNHQLQYANICSIWPTREPLAVCLFWEMQSTELLKKERKKERRKDWVSAYLSQLKNCRC